MLGRTSQDRLQSVKYSLIGILIEGLSEKEVKKICCDFARKSKAVIRNDLWRQIDRNIKLGRKVLVVTASLQMAVDEVFEGTEVNVIGTKFEMLYGRFTSNVDGLKCYGPNKVTAIRFWEKSQIGEVKYLEAWSDSISDLPMMLLSPKRFWICPPGIPSEIRSIDPNGFVYDHRLEEIC